MRNFAFLKLVCKNTKKNMQKTNRYTGYLQKTFVLLIMLACVFPCANAGKNSRNKRPKNVIYIIGDGMGTSHVYSSIVVQKGRSQFLRFPYTGFSRTYSANNYTTDSGAGGTALMTMHKVDNRHIGMSSDGKAYCSMLERATKKNKQVGFVVTSSVLDATPASTYAHVTDRHMFDTISMQMAKAPFTVMIGGDRNHFMTENRNDGKSPLDTLADRGYSLAFSLDAMDAVKKGPLCALVTDDNPASAEFRNDMLCRGVKKAIDILKKSKNGFFLVIEGSQIDWACHDNDFKHLKAEMIDFENMLEIVLNWAAKDKNTLVVVTADHETGGLSLPNGDLDRGKNEYNFSTSNHTGVMVPVFAYGPSAQKFTGIHQNIDLPDIIWNAVFK